MGGRSGRVCNRVLSVDCYRAGRAGTVGAALFNGNRNKAAQFGSTAQRDQQVDTKCIRADIGLVDDGEGRTKGQAIFEFVFSRD